MFRNTMLLIRENKLTLLFQICVYLLEHKPNLNRRQEAMNFRGGSKVSFARGEGPI